MNLLDVNFHSGLASLRSLLTWVKNQDLSMACKLWRLERFYDSFFFFLLFFFAALAFAVLHSLFHQVQIDFYLVPDSLLIVDPRSIS